MVQGSAHTSLLDKPKTVNPQVCCYSPATVAFTADGASPQVHHGNRVTFARSVPIGEHGQGVRSSHRRQLV